MVSPKLGPENDGTLTGLFNGNYRDRCTQLVYLIPYKLSPQINAKVLELIREDLIRFLFRNSFNITTFLRPGVGANLEEKIYFIIK